MRRRWLRRLNRRMRRENWLALGLVLAIFFIILLAAKSYPDIKTYPSGQDQPHKNSQFPIG